MPATKNHNLEPVFRMLAALTPEERAAVRRRLLDDETQQETNARVNRSIKNLERGDGVRLTMNELEALIKRKTTRPRQDAEKRKT